MQADRRCPEIWCRLRLRITTLNHFSWADLVESRQAYIGRIHQSHQNVPGTKNQITGSCKGFARFVDSHTVEVERRAVQRRSHPDRHRRRPEVPTIPGAELGIDSDGFFDLQPASPNGSPWWVPATIAVEIAGVMQALGPETHLVVRKHAPLRNFDPMIHETLVEIMAQEGPKLHTHAIPKGRHQERRRQPDPAAGRWSPPHRRLPDPWAIGRVPTTDSLNLAATGIG